MNETSFWPLFCITDSVWSNPSDIIFNAFIHSRKARGVSTRRAQSNDWLIHEDDGERTRARRRFWLFCWRFVRCRANTRGCKWQNKLNVMTWQKETISRLAFNFARNLSGCWNSSRCHWCHVWVMMPLGDVSHFKIRLGAGFWNKRSF